MQTKQKQLQMSRSRGSWIIKFIWRSGQNAEHWIHLSATQERILAGSVYAIIHAERMRRKKLSIKVETRIVRKTTYASKGPKVTLRNILGHENPDIWCNPWEPEIKIADVTLWPNSIRESQIGRTRNYMDEQYSKDSLTTRTTIWVRRPRRKVMIQAIVSCIRQNLSNSLLTPTWYSKKHDGGVQGAQTLTQLELMLRGEPELRFKNSTQRHHRESEEEHASVHSYIWRLVEGKLVDQVLVGEIKKNLD